MNVCDLVMSQKTKQINKQNNKQGRHNWNEDANYDSVILYKLQHVVAERVRNIRHSKSTYTVNFQACLLNIAMIVCKTGAWMHWIL